jgi:stage II sporulation protein AB (anti-sigma F factor)
VTVGVKLYENGRIQVQVRDRGAGIPDVEKAMEPLYTTGGEERSGLGFSVMQSFTDRLRVRSAEGKGTTVTLEKYISLRVKSR